MLKFSMGTDDGQSLQFMPFIYASACPCAELSVSPVVTVVPVLSFLSQVTNSLTCTYESTVDITKADVNVTVMYTHFHNLSIIFLFYFFLTFHLSSIHKHVIEYLSPLICHRLLL